MLHEPRGAKTATRVARTDERLRRFAYK